MGPTSAGKDAPAMACATRWASVVGACVLIAGGCSAPKPDLTSPQITVAPYSAERGEVLWAVVPLRNESGTSACNPLDVSDKLVAAAEEVRGVRCLPLNRTMEAMRALKMTSINGPSDAAALAAALGADGVLMGSITAYDPYTPTIGLSIALFARSGAMTGSAKVTGGVNTRELSASVTEKPLAVGPLREGLVATVSEHLDGKNHQVQLDVRSYAIGRHNQGDAMGWRRYLASMPLFTEFASSFAVSRVIQQEWIRLGTAALANRTAAAEHPE